MTIIRARAPLRLGLAGGGTDVSPYCDVYGGLVLNATIDRYAYSTLKTINEPIIRFIASDLKQIVEFPLSFPIKNDNSPLALHAAVYNHIIHYFNNKDPIALELTTFCDAPVGSGLGSSSTLVVCMIRAFSELLNLPLDDYSIAKIAFKIERIDCALQGGRQDQYSATFGGINYMEFYANERAIINPLRVKNWIICELESSLLMYFTGTSRQSSKIISEQSNNINSGSQSALEAMHGIKNEALAMKESLLRGDFNGIVESMRQGWTNKKKSASTVSNSEIDDIYEEVIKAGARAGKVSGAGGGGFMLFFVPTERRIQVIQRLSAFGGQTSNCNFTKNGSQAWKILN
jgi:D-glycero-alpha-D-manno-heptose-7-phosphate kinase